MIDFRYHLVSLMAVLIALTMGVILGAGPLQGNITATLSGEVDRLKSRQDSWNLERQKLLTNLSNSDEYLKALGKYLGAGVLQDQQVALVELPGTDDKSVISLKQNLENAGAKVAAEVAVTADFFDSKQGQKVASLAAELQKTLQFKPLPEASDIQNAYEGVLRTLVKPTEQAAVDQSQLNSKYGSLVKIKNVEAPATAAIIIAPNPATSDGENYGGLRQQGKICVQLAQSTLQVWPSGVLFTGNADDSEGFLSEMKKLDSIHLVTADDWGQTGQTELLPLLLRYSLAGGVGHYLVGDKPENLLPQDLKEKLAKQIVPEVPNPAGAPASDAGKTTGQKPAAAENSTEKK